MAHELTLRANGRAEMAFVGETPWHGLGQQITKGASIGVWAKEAGMDWTAESGVPQVFIPAVDSVRGKPQLIEYEDHQAIWRSDNLKPLAIVGANYQKVQPREVLEFFRDLTEQGGWHIHTAGTLRGGRKLWAMASNGESAKIGGKDEVMQNLLLATSLDGSMRTVAAPTAIRVVCANTLAYALEDNEKALRISHRSVFDPEAVKRTLGVAQNSFAAYVERAREMADTPINMEEARVLLAAIFAPPKEKDVKKPDLSWMGGLMDLGKPVDDPDNRIVATILDLFDGGGMGANMKTAKGTRWGLLNAVTEHVDHSMGRTDDTRLDSAWFGRGDAFKRQAFEALVV
jgi:phage/plasmid-like protein (TIGR03299 family)